MEAETQCLYVGYSSKSSESQTSPTRQSATFKCESTEQVSKLFDPEEAGFFYTRPDNPTVNVVEQKIATLEGGVGTLCTAFGQAVTTFSVLTLATTGNHIVSSSVIYGGPLNLLVVMLKRLGIEVTFASPKASEGKIRAVFRPNTEALFGETTANSGVEALDIEEFVRTAYRNSVSLVIDNTFATSVLCRPVEFGADIVMYSATKYTNRHALQMGGVIVDGDIFDWTSGRFPGFTEPDDSYHGTIYMQALGKAAYIAKTRTQIIWDMGACQMPFGAFLTNQGPETLPLCTEHHSQNANAVAHWFERRDKIESVSYPTLKGNPYKEQATKYLPNGRGGVISFSSKDGHETGARFIDSLKMALLLVHVADTRTCMLYPTSSTHHQLTDEQLVSAGITPGVVRLSVGIENIKGILADLEQALAKM